MSDYEYVVVGGGMLGSAIGYGLSRLGSNCAMLDADDRDHRAARGNFGLVWVQSKGADFSEYASWTRTSSALWPALAEELLERTGIDVQYERRGGVHYCLDDSELEGRQDQLQKLAAASGGDFSFEMLDNQRLRELEPAVGKQVAGGSWSANDGHANPLYLLRALQDAFIGTGGIYKPNHRVNEIVRVADGYRINTSAGDIFGKKLVLAAGLDNARLAPMVGLSQPVFPQRGQVLVTERLQPLLRHPSNYLRQTFEGSVQIGDTKEAVGLDDGQSVQGMARMAARACRIIPALGNCRIVRGWGALRVLSEDGYPIYDGKDDAWAFSSHSGVTLAAAHTLALAPMLNKSVMDHSLQAFSAARFQ